MVKLVRSEGGYEERAKSAHPSDVVIDHDKLSRAHLEKHHPEALNFFDAELKEANGRKVKFLYGMDAIKFNRRKRQKTADDFEQ